MLRVLQEIIELRRHGAVHRKGFALAEIKQDFIAGWAAKEAGELWEAVVTNKSVKEKTDEAADVVLCLFHLLVHWYGSDLPKQALFDLERSCLQKLRERFTVPEPLPPGPAQQEAEDHFGNRTTCRICDGTGRAMSRELAVGPCPQCLGTGLAESDYHDGNY